MSRKRIAPVRLFGNDIFTPNTQTYQYQYYRPGCYNVPQISRQITPFTYTYLDNWQPFCNMATYVVDNCGRTYYPSDFEYQLHVPSSMQSPSRQFLYEFYDDGEAEISSIPQIEEEEGDSHDDENVSLRKRKRLTYEEPSAALKKSYCTELNANNIYRSSEGYIVEEPSDNAP